LQAGVTENRLAGGPRSIPGAWGNAHVQDQRHRRQLLYLSSVCSWRTRNQGRTGRHRPNVGQLTLAPVQGWSVCSLQKPPFKWRLGDDGFVPRSGARFRRQSTKPGRSAGAPDVGERV